MDALLDQSNLPAPGRIKQEFKACWMTVMKIRSHKWKIYDDATHTIKNPNLTTLHCAGLSQPVALMVYVNAFYSWFGRWCMESWMKLLWTSGTKYVSPSFAPAQRYCWPTPATSSKTNNCMGLSCCCWLGNNKHFPKKTHVDNAAVVSRSNN